MCKSSASLGLRLILFLGKAQILSTFSVCLAIGLQGIPCPANQNPVRPDMALFTRKNRHPQAINSLGSRCQRELHLSTSHSLRLEGTLCDTSAHQRRRGPRAVGSSADEPLAHEYSHFSGSHPHFLAVVGVTYRTLQQPQLGPWQLISWNGPSRPISVVQ